MDVEFAWHGGLDLVEELAELGPAGIWITEAESSIAVAAARALGVPIP
jgi:hypothetical protein